ncbi:hypothetical protein, partial [Tetragenococcus halophilus]|uniref:hypothetical protein n=1 Tax=Tetragenococcus halophilus TaxID=51669 RepID=UPI001CA4DD72
KWSAVYENRTYGATGGAEIYFPSTLLPILKKKQKVVVFVLNFPELSHFDYLGSQNRAKKR